MAREPTIVYRISLDHLGAGGPNFAKFSLDERQHLHPRM
jgi:hypothetical protein